ncbi:MAG: hypothetical protein LBK13_02100 [Spirochaetales bacterium]|jgi:hypothetical protein|nr:hypothetical protein [Spirochaetales bacterium]
MIIKEIMQKMYIKKMFSKYLDKKTIEKILNNDIKLEEPEEKECGYIFIDIKQNSYFNETLNKVLYYSKNKKFIDFIYGSIIIFIICKSKRNKDIDIDESLNDFIEKFPKDGMQDIRGIYGIDKAKIGNFGITGRYSYMVLVNNYFGKIVELNEINYGEIIENKI